MSGARGKRASIEAVLELGEDVFKILGDLVLEMSLDGVYVRVIGQESSMRMTNDQLVGRRLGETVPGAGAEAMRAALERLGRGGGPQFIEYHVPLPSGALEYYEARLVLASNGNALIFVRNVSARQRASTSSLVHRSMLAKHRAQPLRSR